MNMRAVTIIGLAILVSGCSGMNGDTVPTSKYVFSVDSEDPEVLNETAREIDSRFAAYRSSYRVEISEQENQVEVFIPGSYIPPEEPGGSGEYRTHNRSFVTENGILGESNNVSLDVHLPVMLHDDDVLRAGENYSVSIEGSSLEVSGESYSKGDTFTLNNTEFTVKTAGESSVVEAKIYDESDVESASLGRISKSGTAFRGRARIHVNEEASERLYRTAQNYDYGNRYLEMENGSSVMLKSSYGNGEISEARVSTSFKTQKVRSLSLSIGGESADEVGDQLEEIVRGLMYSELPAEVELTDFQEIQKQESYFIPEEVREQ